MSHLIPAKEHKFRRRKGGGEVKQAALLLDDTSVFTLPVLMMAFGHIDPEVTHKVMRKFGIEPDLKHGASMVFIGKSFREQIARRKEVLDETGDSVRQKSSEPIPAAMLAGSEDGAGTAAKRQNERASRSPGRRKQNRAHTKPGD